MIHLIGAGTSDKGKDIDLHVVKPKFKTGFERIYRPLLDNGMTIEDLNAAEQDTYVETLRDGSKIEWVLPHKRAFPDFINTHFGENAKYLSDKDMFLKSIAESTDDSPPFSYQILIRDYLRFGTPYRSLLLEHGLGSGKSRSAIMVAETFREQGLPTLILTPAFLRMNFMDEIHKWGGEDIRITADMIPSEANRRQALIDQSYHFVHYNATGHGIDSKKNGEDIGGKGGVFEQLARLGFGFPKGSKHAVHFPYLYKKYGDLKPLSNMLIIIEEIHNLNRTFIGGTAKSSIKYFMYPFLMMATDCKIIGLSGTPIISSPFEMSTLYSVLRGPIKTGRVDNPIEFALQQDEGLFNDTFVNYDNATLMNREVMMSRIIGLGSLFKGVTDDVDRIIFPAGKDDPMVLELTMSPYQTHFHDLARWKEDEVDKGSRRKLTSLTADVSAGAAMSEAQRILNPNSTFHMESRQASNFVFPMEIMRPRPFEIKAFDFPPLSTYQIKFALPPMETYRKMVKAGVDVSDLLNFEGAPEENKRKLLSDLFKKAYPRPTYKNPEWDLLHEDDKSLFSIYVGDYRDRLRFAVNKLAERADEFLTLEKLGKYSVKMAEIYRRIVGDLKHGACHLVPDEQASTVAAQEVVEEGGYEEPLIEGDLVSNGQMDDESEGADGAEPSVDVTARPAATKVVFDPADELPKYMDVFKTDEELKSMGMRVTGGPALVYSFFNSVEGAGIFSKVLEVHGFKQVTESTWDGTSPIASLKREPRYAFIKGEMRASLKAKVMRIFNSPANRHGQLIRVVFVTQAAAEGISLYHLRQIHIMEPHWDNLLIEQVIGRGFRLRSHRYLSDKREREIQIFQYYAERAKDMPRVGAAGPMPVAKPKEIDEFVQMHLAKGLPEDARATPTGLMPPTPNESIDKLVQKVADRKSKLISQLKQIRGAAAIDCKINSDYNNSGGKKIYECFDFRGNTRGDAFTAAIADDVEANKGVKKTVETEIMYYHFEFEGKTYIKYPGKRVTIQMQAPDNSIKRRKAEVFYSVPAWWKVDDPVDPHDFKKAGYLVGTKVLFMNSAITEV